MTDGTYNYNVLRINGSATFALEDAVSIRADMHILGGSLDVTAADCGITLGGNWENSVDAASWNPVTEVWDMTPAGFIARAGTVTFTNSAVYVYGSTCWYIFYSSLPAGGTIYFENDHVQRIVTGGYFYIHGGDAFNVITLTRMTDTGVPSNPPVTSTEDDRFWFFDLIPGATLDMEFAIVRYSNARSFPVSVPADVLATPYSTYYSYKWLSLLLAMYSYTEDSDYDGKLDRIRVTTEAAVGNDFSGFVAVVTGYTVTGYSRPAAGNNFYILLEEKNYTDTGATPQWHVAANTSLRDEATDTKLAWNPFPDRWLRLHDAG